MCGWSLSLNSIISETQVDIMLHIRSAWLGWGLLGCHWGINSLSCPSQSMITEQMIVHASGDPTVPFLDGYFFYYLPHKETKDGRHRIYMYMYMHV